MKKLLYSMLVFAVMMLFAGKTSAMGIFQSDIGYIPMPSINISLTVTDNLGVRTAVEHGSIDGKDYISGYHGLILNVIPLKNITSISFTKTTNAQASLPASLLDKLDNNPFEATINLKDHKTLTLIVDGSLICYGKTPYGFIRIKLSLIDRIENIVLIKENKTP